MLQYKNKCCKIFSTLMKIWLSNPKLNKWSTSSKNFPTPITTQLANIDGNRRNHRIKPISSSWISQVSEHAEKGDSGDRIPHTTSPTDTLLTDDPTSTTSAHKSVQAGNVKLSSPPAKNFITYKRRLKYQTNKSTMTNRSTMNIKTLMNA